MDCFLEKRMDGTCAQRKVFYSDACFCTVWHHESGNCKINALAHGGYVGIPSREWHSGGRSDGRRLDELGAVL